MNSIGLYLHIPFCDGKCFYCDFYSMTAADPFMEQYTDLLCAQLRAWGQSLALSADTLYIGGGTPSLLGGEHLSRLIRTARENFSLSGAEITVEVNPGTKDLTDTIFRLADAGVNRLSAGMQSIHEPELRALGRRHTHRQLEDTLRAAREAGIKNLSLDLMLGIPHQTPATLKESISFCGDAGIQHASAYLLKIEEGTPFHRQKDALSLPDEDLERTLYLTACEELERIGFRQYEISNFARPGAESAHNLHYWNAEPYLGLGPAAHSFLDGRRFYYPRDLSAYLLAPTPIDDGEGGGAEEYAMLRLRLADGLTEEGFQNHFGTPIPAEYRTRMADPNLRRLCVSDEKGIRLTREGFLLSNLLTGRMLGC